MYIARVQGSGEIQMRLRLPAPVIGALLLGCAAIGLAQTNGAAASDQAANNAPVGSEQNPVRVSSGVMMGLSIRHEAPQYPGHKCGEPAPSGQVVTRAIINPEGKVDKLTVISGPEERREPNLKALRQWTYKPYLLNGNAVWVQTTIMVIIDMGCEPK
jgi:Gram-negative bacterial TonB protein C-terminal